MKRNEIIDSIEPFLKTLALIPPDTADVKKHYYVDYVELLVLFSKYTIFTTSEIIDRFKDALIFKQVKDADLQAQRNDENERFIDEIFQILEDRATYYGENYPFDFVSRSIKLKDTILDRQKVYLYLLISSNLNIFRKYYVNLTTDFEALSLEVMLNFMPPSAVVKPFGKNSDYAGYAVEKIRELAAEIKIEIDEEKLSRISSLGKEERGLDVIGWIPFDDKVGNKFLLLGQCTCQKEWFKKQSETRRYRAYFNFDGITPQTAMFIPYALIDFQKNGFHQGDEVDNTLIFERKRLLNYLSDTNFFDGFDSKIIVDKCLAMQSDIV